MHLNDQKEEENKARILRLENQELWNFLLRDSKGRPSSSIENYRDASLRLPTKDGMRKFLSHRIIPCL